MSHSIVFLCHKTDASYLPIENKNTRLNYLADLGNGSPFTIEQEKVFTTARTLEKINLWSLRIGLGLCVALSVAPAFFELKTVQAWENRNQKSAATMLAIAIGAIGIINYICTGTLPDAAATDSIRAEDEVIQTRKMYEEIAYHLLEIYANDQNTAKTPAQKIDIPKIQTAMTKLIPSKTAEDICSVLKHASYAVLNDQPHDDAPPSIKAQFKTIQLQKEVQTLTELVKGHWRSA